MALRMFLGKPGGGKSSGALRDIVHELTRGQRVVVTNLSIDPGELNAFLQKRFPAEDIDLHKRLLLLDEKQSRRFWLYRSPTVTVPDVTKEQEKAGTFPNFGAYAESGVLYVIDEAHIMFDARAWMDSGQSLTYYNSQHRKLNDELVFVTQFLELIDKRVRGFAQEYWYFRNNGLEKIFTFFVLPKYFTVAVYQRPATNPHDKPSEVHRYTLDLEMARCYDTSAGIGIKGRKSPEKTGKKGFNIAWLSVPAALGLYLMWAAPNWAGEAIAGTASGARVAEAAGFVEKRADIGNQNVALGAPSPSGRPPVDVGKTSSVASADDLHVRGYIVLAGRVNILLSDGRTLTEGDGTVARIERNRVVLQDGTTLWLRKATPSALPAASRQ